LLKIIKLFNVENASLKANAHTQQSDC